MPHLLLLALLPPAFAPLSAQAESGPLPNCQFLPSPLTEEFDFRFEVSFTEPESNLQIWVNVLSATDAVLLDVSAREARCFKVQAGVRLPMGWHAPALQEPAAKTELVLKRRRDLLRLYRRSLLIAEAFDQTFSGGRLGLKFDENAVQVSRPRYQPATELYFCDDFMREDTTSAWEKLYGDWQLRSLSHASMSSNAFTYQGVSGDLPAIVVTGHPYWDSYRIQASLRWSDEQPAGLVLYLKDLRNYYTLQWKGGVAGTLALVRVASGEPLVMASCPLAQIPGHWYRLALSAAHGEIHAAVDGQEYLRAQDTAFFDGRAGLYSYSPAGVSFDDVIIEPFRELSIRFDEPDSGLFTHRSGRWERPQSLTSGVLPGDACLQVQTAGPARSLLAYSVPAPFVFETDTFSLDGEFGLCFSYRDEQNYWTARFGNQGASLVEVRDGNAVERDRVDEPFLPAIRRLALQVHPPTIQVLVDGRVLMAASSTFPPPATVGLYASGTSRTAFDNVDLRFPPAPKPVFIQHEVFSGESTMANWAAAQSDWMETSWGNEPARWHRGNFFGDCAARVRLARRESNPATLRLSLGASGNATEAGAVLEVTLGDTADLRLLHAGRVLAERRSLPFPLPATLSFQRSGPFLVAALDAHPLLDARMAGPVSGTQIGWSASGFPVAPQDVEILSGNCKVYNFHDAPVDWIPASGLWQVTNRWECDPRWSFFAGVSPQLAALWHKGRLRGDVSVEFAAAIKMDNSRGGGNYQYASDINVALCADGRDLTSGYNLMFGGWGNTVTRILRNRTVVAETAASRIAHEHRMWIYVKAERRGRLVRLSINNQPVLSFEDPEPLAGDRVALWTWNNGLMVARVRLSAEEFSGLTALEGIQDSWKTCPYLVSTDAAAIASLQQRLRSKDPQELAAAAIEAAKLRDPASVSALLPLLSVEHDDCRWQAASALAAIGLPGIQALLGVLDHPSEQARWKAEAALRRSGPAAAASIVHVLKNGSALQRRSCAYILRDFPGPDTRDALALALADDDADVPWKAADSLVQLGPTSVPAVVRALRSERPGARACAAWLLHQFGNQAPVEPLIAALEDPDIRVRWKAAIALKERLPRPSIPILAALELTGDVARPHLQWILEEWRDPELQRAIKKASGRNGSKTVGKAASWRTRTGAPFQAFSFRVETDPAGASVFLDDLFLGTSPGNFVCPRAGQHLLRLERFGFIPHVQAIEKDSSPTIRTALEPQASAALILASSPSGAPVFLDQESRGVTPARLDGIRPGRHSLRLELQGYLPVQKDIELPPHGSSELHLRLTSESEQFYLEAMAKKPQDVSFRCELAHIYFLRNEFDRAREQLLQSFRLVEKGQDSSGYISRLQQWVDKANSAYFTYGDANAIQTGRQTLESLFVQLCHEFPGNAYYWITLCTLQRQRNAKAEALASLTQAAQTVGQNWQIHLWLGITQYELAAEGRKDLKAAALQSLRTARNLTGNAQEHQQIDPYIDAASKLPD
ncbi:MAG: HEAT repeat domain-containing protein [Planctomycetes bacterium]|nr:HEAT repeat domain-containing protein [Planctomycetota bacterium]